MTVAVVIPCRNEAVHIEGLLTALWNQTRRPDEIVVVDDGSTDQTVARIEDWCTRHASAAVRCVPGPGRGPGPAVNAGIRQTAADIIVRFDGHSVPDVQYVEASVAVAADPTVGVAGGWWRIAPGAPTAEAAAIAAVVSHPLGSGGASYRSGSIAAPTDVETVPFGTFRRQVWEQLGGFDESLDANQDFDFNFRARKAGWRVVLDPRIASTYVARGTLAALGRQYHRYGFWKYRMLRKDASAIAWRQLPPAVLAPWVLLSVGGAFWSGTFAGVVAAGVYPGVVLIAAGQVASERRVSPLWAALALACAHLSWSVGFWRAAIGLAPPR